MIEDEGHGECVCVCVWECGWVRAYKTTKEFDQSNARVVVLLDLECAQEGRQQCIQSKELAIKGNG